jgi:hypothetical protein
MSCRVILSQAEGTPSIGSRLVAGGPSTARELRGAKLPLHSGWQEIE